MTDTENTTTEIVETQIFSVQDLRNAEVLRLEEVAKKWQEAIDIEITDKASLKLVHDARIVLQKNRTTISKARLAFTAGLTQAQKDAIQIEKDLIAIISPIEIALDDKEKVYEAEQARIKKEKEDAEQANIQKRFDALNEIEAVFIPGEVAKMSDEGFPFFYEMHKKRYEQKLEERKQAEEKRAQEQAEIDRKNAEAAEELRKQKEEQDKIAEDNRKEAARIAEEQAEKARELAQKEKEIKDREDEQKLQEEQKKAEDELRKIEEDKERRQKKFAEQNKAYTEWLLSNGWTEETKEEYTTIIKRHGEDNKETTILLYKKISEYTVAKNTDEETSEE